MSRDLRGAGESGGFDRDNMHVSRLALSLDDEAWNELSSLLSDVLERARLIQEDANKRRKKSGQPAIPTTLVLLQFEGARAAPAKKAQRS